MVSTCRIVEKVKDFRATMSRENESTLSVIDVGVEMNTSRIPVPHLRDESQAFRLEGHSVLLCRTFHLLQRGQKYLGLGGTNERCCCSYCFFISVMSYSAASVDVFKDGLSSWEFPCQAGDASFL